MHSCMENTPKHFFYYNNKINNLFWYEDYIHSCMENSPKNIFKDREMYIKFILIRYELQWLTIASFK